MGWVNYDNLDDGWSAWGRPEYEYGKISVL
jgi:hypothetical protein